MILIARKKDKQIEDVYGWISSTENGILEALQSPGLTSRTNRNSIGDFINGRLEGDNRLDNRPLGRGKGTSTTPVDRENPSNSSFETLKQLQASYQSALRKGDKEAADKIRHLWN